ncbi:biotin carboxylase N-terminal domain-containing protein [Cryobacterium sp. SO2]|uniref:acetyl/propionyl/methylcrotonyl-CoA carboxylase subunit alpha n=1 Tax=Cryobacterium sp. SO2 TaxID=1897060 RepID=UPI00223D485A|nr:biotin carboxylase N-terminal domain-containing protein [Cryobacterium sp. SO2]WEO77273.1 biotin carboxylase N-terminal domain-containing protein [Cryobacterium sp. SO2]
MKKVLIANRGEIAVRIIRACADRGLDTVAVYADSDAAAIHVRLATEAWGLDGDSPATTYLDAEKLIGIAQQSGADAVHPGYGFLSESASFARKVIEAGLTWIGPSPESIDLLGDKIAARQLAASVGAPLVAGTPDPVASAADAVAFAEEHGLPIVIKAAFGGGGRGMRVARSLDEVTEQYDAAVREAVTAFGRGECFVEQFLDAPRHVEVQVLSDSHGNVVVLGTRDCSLQRRNQKLVEEAPAPFLTDEQRDRLHTSAAAICAAAHYQGVATVEYLLSVDGTISFLEVNTRLQVEHPVTEETTGVDIVAEQLRIAEGLPLSVQATPAPTGHSLEFRINAEDAARGFLPTPGLITRFEAPTGPGIRVDSGVETGTVVSGRFDSMLAKLIVTGPTREIAIRRARRALDEFVLEGIPSVLPFHRAVLRDDDFAGGDALQVHTQWIETSFAERMPADALRQEPEEPGITSSWIEIDGRRHTLRMPAGAGALTGASALANVGAPAPADAAATPPDGLVAPMAGTVIAWLVEDGTEVAEGDPVVVMEAMKMETTIVATGAGTLRQHCAPGDALAAGEQLATLE